MSLQVKNMTMPAIFTIVVGMAHLRYPADDEVLDALSGVVLRHMGASESLENVRVCLLPWAFATLGGDRPLTPLRRQFFETAVRSAQKQILPMQIACDIQEEGGERPREEKIIHCQNHPVLQS